MRRGLAIVSLICLGLLVAFIAALVITDLPAVLLAILGLAATAWGGWWAITERMPRRALGLAALLAGLAVIVTGITITADDGLRPWWVFVAIVVLTAVAAASARGAVTSSLHEIDLINTCPPFHPRKPVLICNPNSGGGKAKEFHIVEKARELGVEVLLLEPGTDLEELARGAVQKGADCLGMAGGDGSLAPVAAIATAHGLPFVCISVGTRNHFALDLGLDRTDPAAGLSAFTDGVIRTVDFGSVNKRPFVNNVSLGVYAEIIKRDEYRDDKLGTAAALLPDLLGEAAEPFDLQFTGPGGNEVEGAFLVLVSSNPYVLGPTLDFSQRRSLTTGDLGVVALTASTGTEAAALVTNAALGGLTDDPNLHQFTTRTFEIRSRSGRAHLGIDGEAVTMETPLQFTIKPRGLRVLVPKDNPGATVARHYRSFGVRGLWEIARGRQPIQQSVL